MKTWKFALGAVAILALGGCMQPITDYVGTAHPDRGAGAPALNAQGPSAMKVSPGRMTASAPGTALVGNVTATDKVLSSPQVSMRASISRSRTSK